MAGSDVCCPDLSWGQHLGTHYRGVITLLLVTEICTETLLIALVRERE